MSDRYGPLLTPGLDTDMAWTRIRQVYRLLRLARGR